MGFVRAGITRVMDDHKPLSKVMEIEPRSSKRTESSDLNH